MGQLGTRCFTAAAKTEVIVTFNNKDFIVGTIIGSGIAAATVLLFTPQSGKQLRKTLHDRVSKTSLNAKKTNSYPHKTIYAKKAMALSKRKPQKKRKTKVSNAKLTGHRHENPK